MSYAVLGGKVAVADSLIDGFHRFRVSFPFTLFDQAFEWDMGPLFWDTATVGGGTIAYSPNDSSVLLQVGVGATDSVIRQTFAYHHYRPGKSHLIPVTFTFGAGVADLRRRAGYFDGEDGIYLEQVGSEVALVRRSFVTGVMDEERVLQSAWSEDKLLGQGTGPSGITLDLSLGQLLVVDLQWLSEGTVRVGFDIGGAIVYVHHFHAANLLTGPYMRTASLPLRYEITNLAAQGGAHTLRQGCSSVITEDGDQDEFGVFLGADTGITRHAVGTTPRALISIRPKATFGPGGKINRVPITAQTIGMIVSTNDAQFELQYNPVFTGTPVWVDPGTHSAVEYSIHTDPSAGALTTPGIRLDPGGHIAAGSGIVATAVIQNPVLSKLPIARDMAGANPRAVSLVARSFAGTSNIAASIGWKEVR